MSGLSMLRGMSRIGLIMVNVSWVFDNLCFVGMLFG